ncbi:DUF5067 domain-containing protein [Staphylococcus pseudintermedius]|uniref:DUF5067 domain-containing protein n=1 Tax=Staphylococcus pseudintermedius TaxID=283734 RepID=UPI00292A17F7|nr:DUF5067 domain-containing protein [Staphylococcus pseudintermedius]MDU9320109.1 DUF5067 domain-containing protein [Staphylococcus pseudintermedius]
MKKVLFLLLASTLVLAACGNESKKENDSKQESKKSEPKKEEKVNENTPTFKNDTLVIDDAVLKIKDTIIVHDKDINKKMIVFKYEVKSKSGKEGVTPNNVFIAVFSVFQDTKNSVAHLEVGMTPSTGEYEEWSKHADDMIKKGKTSKGIMSYELENDKNVTLKATKGIGGKKLGEKEIDLSKLKTVEYSLTEDIKNKSSK